MSTAAATVPRSATTLRVGVQAGYPIYRESGVEWLGRTPEHWDVKRLKHLCLRSALYGANEAASGYQDEGIRFLRTSDIDDAGALSAVEAVYLDVDSVRDYLLSDGDLLLSRSGTLGRSFVFSSVEHGQCAYAGYLVRFVLGPRLLPRFAFYFTKTKPFEQWVQLAAIAATIGNVNGQKFANVHIPVPPLEEQKTIVEWLDDRTARIDELVSAKRQLIDLLEEQRSSLITKFVTKGHDPEAPVKESGIDWLGRVPAHWEIKPLKYAVTFQRGHDLPAEERCEGEVPVVTSAGPSAWHNRAVAQGPGIVTGRYGTIGVFYLVNGPYWPLNTTLYSTNLHGNNPKFLRHMLHTMKPVFLLNAAKSAVPGVDRNDLHPIPVAVPPRAEQDQIALHLDMVERRANELVAATTTAIDKLQEYRQALITAAVTGRIDVRKGAEQ